MNDKYNKTADIDGIEMTLGGQKLTIPPLNFKQLKQLRPKIAQLQGGLAGVPDDEKMETFINICGMAIRRNYANLDNEALEELLDLNNIGEVMIAILNSSGLVRKADSLGKLMERIESLNRENSTGTSSSVPSSPTQDGPGSTLTNA